MTEFLTVYSPAHFDPVDSYGLIGCELVRHLDKLDIYASAVAKGNHRHPNQDDEVAKLTARNIVPTTGGILLGYPTAYSSYGELANLGPKIAVTMFESTKIPEDWVPTLNECDAVIVPSNFCFDSFRKSGVTSRMHVLTLGIDPRFTEKERSQEDPFTFLAFLDRGARKGGLLSLESFYEEFGDDPRVKLVLKGRDRRGKTQLNFTNGNIDVIQKDYIVEEMRDLYWSCHCLVNPNKGEGFGLIPREFAATGGISLTTDWGGTAELIDVWGYPIKANVEKATWDGIKKFQGKDLGFWASPDREDIKAKMRFLFENRDLFSEEFYRKAKNVQSLYNWDSFAAGIAKIWKELISVYA